MKIATWNINSIRVRAEQLRNWLENSRADIVLLQETKCIDEAFPREMFEDIGYNIATYGQKTYNGVAILSKFMIEDIIRGDFIFEDDKQARYIQAFINGYNIASVYVPNGTDPLCEQYYYKLKFLSTLKNHVRQMEKFVLGGDFNIARNDQDVYDPGLWRDKICCTIQEREALNAIITECGLSDCLREQHLEQNDLYTWWNYRAGGFAKNYGLRLDYLFVTSDIKYSNTTVGTEMRCQQRPSDHAPVIMDFC